MKMLCLILVEEAITQSVCIKSPEVKWIAIAIDCYYTLHYNLQSLFAILTLFLYELLKSLSSPSYIFSANSFISDEHNRLFSSEFCLHTLLTLKKSLGHDNTSPIHLSSVHQQLHKRNFGLCNGMQQKKRKLLCIYLK